MTNGTALGGEQVIRSRIAKNGWVMTRNPNYKFQYKASDRPWRVIHTLWVEHSEGDYGSGAWKAGEFEKYVEKDPPHLYDHAVAKVYDPRIERWVYRRLGRVDKESEWEFLRPRVFPPHFDSLKRARRPGFFFRPELSEGDKEQRTGDTYYWVRDDED